MSLLLELLQDPRRFREVPPEARHRAVRTGSFGRLFVAVEEGDRAPKVVDDRVAALLEPLVAAARSRADDAEGKTKGPLGGPVCSETINMAGLLETYRHMYPQVQDLHARLTAPLTTDTDSAATGRR